MVLSPERLAKLTEHAARWCGESNLPITEENINRYLAMRSLSLGVFDLRRVYEAMLQVEDDGSLFVNETALPYTYNPVTIHRRRGPKFWVPSQKDAECVVARTGHLGSEDALSKYEIIDILDAKPHVESSVRRQEHNAMLIAERQKIEQSEHVERKPAVKHKKVILVSY